MNTFDQFTRAIGTLNDEAKSRIAIATNWRTTHPGQEYSPPELSAMGRNAERIILKTCQELLDTAGHPYVEAQLVEWAFGHRSLRYPSSDPILVVSDFVTWQNQQPDFVMELAKSEKSKNSPVATH